MKISPNRNAQYAGGGSSKRQRFSRAWRISSNWGRKNSLWPLPFGTACCAIEYMSVVSSHYDISRFGAEVVRFSPRQADCMLVLGTVVEKMGPVFRQIYDQMLEPKWVIAVGSVRFIGWLLSGISCDAGN